jgi:hypothetical protein
MVSYLQKQGCVFLAKCTASTMRLDWNALFGKSRKERSVYSLCNAWMCDLTSFVSGNSSMISDKKQGAAGITTAAPYIAG